MWREEKRGGKEEEGIEGGREKGEGGIEGARERRKLREEGRGGMWGEENRTEARRLPPSSTHTHKHTLV